MFHGVFGILIDLSWVCISLLLEIFQGKYFKVEIVVSYFLQIDYFNFSVLSEE